MINPHVVRRTTNPVDAPPEAGIHWINTVTNEEFFSVGTLNVGDWISRASPTIEDQIVDGNVNYAPSQNAVYDALQLKVDKSGTKVLSDNNYTNTDKASVGTIANKVNKAGDTMTGKLNLTASTASSASMNIPDGVSPASYVCGDLWNTEESLFFGCSSSYHQLNYDSNTVGPLSQATITDNLDGTINVGSIDCFLYSTNSWTGSYKRYTIHAASNLSLTDNSINYLVVNYNSGSPVFQVITSPSTINNSNITLSALMSREGTAIHFIPVSWGLATAIRQNNRDINLQRYQRVSGLTLSETATRVINISSGVIYYGINALSKGAVVSTGSQAVFYAHSAGNWTRSLVSDYNNSQYDNGTNLVSLGANRYAVNWVYRYVDGDGLPGIAYVLGTGDYTLAQAQASTSPTPPSIMGTMAILVGRIIVQNGASTATQIDSAFVTALAGGIVTNHNDLNDLQGGTSAEYYHLTSQEHTKLQNELQVTSTASSAGTLALTSSSSNLQIITGTTTHTITLPLANALGAGISQKLIIKNRSTGNITVDRSGSDTIDGLTSITLTLNQSVTLMSNGSDQWVIV